MAYGTTGLLGMLDDKFELLLPVCSSLSFVCVVCSICLGSMAVMLQRSNGVVVHLQRRCQLPIVPKHDP